MRTLILLLTLTGGGNVYQKQIEFENVNDCNRAAALLTHYVPGARAECLWRVEA